MSAFEPRGLNTPDNKFLRAGVWALNAGVSPRAICVLLGGHSEFAEKYDEVASELNQRGFVVVTVDWRGQGASERLARGSYKSHVTRFDEYELDLVTLFKQVVEPMSRESGLPMIALAHSMGGHILLRFLHEYGKRITCAVLTAPMVAINLGGVPSWVARSVAFGANLRGPSQAFVFGAAAHDPLEIPFEQNTVTSDRGRYRRTQAILKEKPYLRIFGPTFSWLKAALGSVAQIRRPSFARKIDVPLLVEGAGRDRVVPTQAIRDYVKLLPDCAYVELRDAEHEILMETDAVRAQFWTAFDNFVGPYLGAQQR